MKNLPFWLPFALFLLNISACNSQDDAPVEDSEWDLPVDEIISGGVGKDGIPSIDNPKFAPVSAINYMQDNDLIVGFLSDGDIKGYTHPVLDWHEIVNDQVGNIAVAITYCPLTGSAIAWDRQINGRTTTFGVSGLLYNTNLLPYDRLTDSRWSQMGLRAVNGELRGSPVNTHPAVEMPWSTWKTMFPNSAVLTTETGFNRSYGTYPYRRGNGEDYRVDDFLLFSVKPFDRRLPPKERVLGVSVNGQSRAYRFENFKAQPIDLLLEELGGRSLVVVGSQTLNFIAAYERPTDANSQALEFEPVQDALPAVMQDSKGNRWDVFGRAVEGPQQGERLTPVESYIAYWVAWGAFHPESEIAEE